MGHRAHRRSRARRGSGRGDVRRGADRGTALPAESGAVDAWLLGIARNKLRESRRRGRIEQSARKRLAIEPVAITDADLERIDELASRDEEILGLVQSLPTAQRDALLGRFVGERSYRELAGELQCSEMIVRQRVSRGLRALRSRLEERL